MPDQPTVTTKAIVLARGLGTRMRANNNGATASLTNDQRAAADSGLKAMMPVAGGALFLDYVLSSLGDAGLTNVCVVIGPEHDAVRRRYDLERPLKRLRVEFATQEQPRGTADALLAAQSFAGDESFLALNADNLYPADALARLARTAPPATLAFRRDGLERAGDIARDRIAKFAILDVGADGYVRRVTEKPDASVMSSVTADTWISMNCWHFDSAIFRACGEVGLSPRGEFELPLAVQHAIAKHDARVVTVPVNDSVLDLSQRADVARVVARLQQITVRL